MRDFESPILANRENILVLSDIFFAWSYPPLTPNVTNPLWPLGRYFFANELNLLDCKPG